MWTDCITSIRHVLKLNGYGGPQAKANEKRQRFKGWETLVVYLGFLVVLGFLVILVALVVLAKLDMLCIILFNFATIFRQISYLCKTK